MVLWFVEVLKSGEEALITILQERWKVKQEQGRLQSLQTALEDERKMWTDQQARERANMEKSRVGLMKTEVFDSITCTLSCILSRVDCYILEDQHCLSETGLSSKRSVYSIPT